jgi:hypothetical protein
MPIATFIMAMLQPIIAKILLLLGLSVVTIVGLQSVVGQLKSSIVSSANSMPLDMLNFALFAGIGHGIGIIFGACTTKLILWQIQNATSILGKNSG